MNQNRTMRKLVGVAAAAMISLGVAAPLGVADTLGGAPGCNDANQAACDPAITAPAGTQPTNAQLRSRCIAKAQTKFGDNRPKKKAAIKKCKKKYR